MIQILSVKDLKQRENICKLAGISESPSLSIIAAFNEKNEIEIGAIFKYEGSEGEILWLEIKEDIDLAVGLAKSIFSIMEYRGVKTVFLPMSFAALEKSLRLKPQGDRYAVDLSNYFTCACQHG